MPIASFRDNLHKLSKPRFCKKEREKKKKKEEEKHNHLAVHWICLVKVTGPSKYQTHRTVHAKNLPAEIVWRMLKPLSVTHFFVTQFTVLSVPTATKWPSTSAQPTSRAKNLLYYCFNLNDCSGPEVIELFSCSTQLSMKISLLINMKMPTIVGIFIFISREIFMLSYV